MNEQNTGQFLHFNIDPPDTTHQAALRILKTKDGRQFVGKMKGSKAKNFEGQWRAEIRPKRPKFPIEKGTPVRVVFGLFYKSCKSRPCKEIQWKTTKPDADNVIKTMLDCLVEEGYIATDQQVADLRVMKLEWDHGGFVEVLIQPCTPFLRG